MYMFLNVCDQSPWVYYVAYKQKAMQMSCQSNYSLGATLVIESQPVR